MGNRAYSPHEDEIIRQEWGKLSLFEIGKMIDRLPQAVGQRGRKLGLPSRGPVGNHLPRLATVEIPNRLKAIERNGEPARWLRLMLSMVMDDPPLEIDLVLLSDANIEAAQRWALDQARYYRRLADGFHVNQLREPKRPNFLMQTAVA